MKQAFVVGGQGNFVKDKLAKSLARHGISIHQHWSWDKTKPPIKLPDVDLVYICTDMVAHKVSVPCMDMARDMGIPYVNGTRKWAESIERLTTAGFPLHNPAENLPLILDESLPKGRKDRQRPPTESELRGVMIAMAGTTDMNKAPLIVADQFMPSVSTLAASMNAPIADSKPYVSTLVDSNPKPQTPAVQEAPMADPKNYRDRSKTLGISNNVQQAYLHALIHEPNISNDQMWERLKDHPFLKDKKFDAQRGATARAQLGIEVDRRGGQRRVTVDLLKFGATARGIGLKSFKTPEPLYVEADPAQLPPSMRPVVTPTPVTAPAAAGEMKDLKEILALLRVAMKELNIVDLHVTPESVKYKQVTISEGELAV